MTSGVYKYAASSPSGPVNGEQVAAEHYLQVTRAHFALAAESRSDPPLLMPL